MLKVINEIKASDFGEIYNIEFKYSKGNYNSMSCQTLMTFDIETSNGWRQPDGQVIGFDHEKYLNDEEYKNKIDNGEPMSLLYVWQFAVESENGPVVFMGRTWDDYFQFKEMLTREIRRQAIYGIKSVNRDSENFYAASTKNNVSAKIYVHNLGFEFQHLRNLYNEEMGKPGKGRHSKEGTVFARSARKPMKFTLHINRVAVEYRDTLVLTQKSLKSWCKDEKLPVQKLEEPKDYYLEIRTPKTQLNDEEIQYSINDVVSMLYGLEKYRDKFEKLNNIPLTQTGAVRLKCKERVCMTNPDWSAKCCEITKAYTPDDFKRLCQLFQGGWTHGNKMYIDKVIHDVRCFDFASSYPAVMTTRTFPIDHFEKCDVSEFDKLEQQDLNNPDYHWYAKIRIKDFVSCLDNSYWSTSKCCSEMVDGKNTLLIKNYTADNGRIYSAEELTAYMTDLDWDTFKQCYTIYGGVEILELYKSKSGYLCKELITTILEYFSYKTSLKGNAEEESRYTESKQFVNSIYGCAVTKIVIDMVTFGTNGWDTTKFNDEMFYDTINRAKPENTFLAYQMGIWVTSWARHNLFDFIINLDKRVAYCDTDSIKGLFTDEDLKFVEDYNKNIEEIENKVASTIGFDPKMYTPKTKKGVTKRLGIMEREEDCQEFKTLGAKRYVDLIDGNIHCTIAGLPKSAGENKLKQVSDFENNIVWTTKESEKLIARYNDNQSESMWIDRDGHMYHSDDRYGICLQPTTFDLSLSKEFTKFLQVLASGKIDKSDEFFSDTTSYLM